jgi:hypothetical protein
VSDESSRYEVYVRPFPPGDGRSGQWLVSSGGGVQSRWRPSGKELFYLAPDGRLMAVDVAVASGGAALQLGTPHTLFQTAVPRSTTSFGYDVSPDGKRFLLLLPSSRVNASPVRVVLNWEAALRK